MATTKRVIYSCPASLSRRLSTIRTSRLYHSAANSQPPPFSQTESAILSAALRHVPRQGFTLNAMTQGAKDSGYLEVSTNLFSRGAFDLVHYHLVTQRLGLRDRLQFSEEDSKRLGLGRKVRDLTWARLQANAEAGIVGRWSEAIALMAQPSYLPASLHELSLLADEIWHLSGDEDVTFAWYTKRGSLGAVYASTELYMTQDTSPGFEDTQRFLDMRLREVQAAGSAIGSVREWAGFSAGAVVNVLRSKGVRI